MAPNLGCSFALAGMSGLRLLRLLNLLADLVLHITVEITLCC
jgi:hypothetical protein